MGATTGSAKSSLSKVETAKQGYTGEFLRKVAEALGVTEIDIYLEASGEIEQGPEIKGTVPLISWVQAGHWQDIPQEDHHHTGNESSGRTQAREPHVPYHAGERVHTTYRARKNTYALRVRGDSMEPKFPDGAILIVEPDENPEPGAFVIVRHNGGEATFKQLMQDGGTRYLKPLNPRYPILEVKPDAVFCGVVKRVEMDV